jgi:Bacterial Ig-like domain
MEINGLKIVGTAAIVAGLMTSAFFAGGIATGDKSSADPEPAATVEVVDQDKGVDNGIVLVGDEQDKTAETEEADQTPEEPETNEPAPPAPAPVEPTPAPAVEPTPLPPTPEPTPVNEAPYVVSISPEDGDTGISPAANVKVVFSESMDKASVQAAFNLSTGNCGAFSWNGDATVMTFDPCGDWSYGSEVEVELYDSAADKLGLGMGDEFGSSFKVIRKVTETLYSDGAYDGYVSAPPVLTLLNPVVASQTITVGTWHRGFLSFDLDDLPEDLTQIVAAEVGVYQVSHSAGAYGLDTGKLMIQSVSYGSLGTSDWGKAAIPFCNGLCMVPFPTDWVLSATSANNLKKADVLGAVMQDWSNRQAQGELSQFRIKFQAENNGMGPNSWAKFASGDSVVNRPFLTITYLVP